MYAARSRLRFSQLLSLLLLVSALALRIVTAKSTAFVMQYLVVGVKSSPPPRHAFLPCLTEAITSRNSLTSSSSGLSKALETVLSGIGWFILYAVSYRSSPDL